MHEGCASRHSPSQQESKMQNFSELPISPSLKERLAAARFFVPTAVQAATIPHAMEGKDVLATAQTGTGKTLAFLIPVMEKLVQRNAPGIGALVLLPTRELAMQVAEQFDALRGRQLAPAALVVGGLSEGPQLNAIRKGARIVIATPGRLEDFLDRRLVQTRRIANAGARRSGSHAGHGISAVDSQDRFDSAERPADNVFLGDDGSFRGASREGLHAESGAARIRIHVETFRERAAAGV